jgi:hypothetical protein
MHINPVQLVDQSPTAAILPTGETYFDANLERPES